MTSHVRRPGRAEIWEAALSSAALGLLIALTVLVTTLAGRPGDSITAAISTTVVMLLAAGSPGNAWEQPILGFADSLVGIVVGIAAVSVALLVIPHPPGSEST